MATILVVLSIFFHVSYSMPINNTDYVRSNSNSTGPFLGQLGVDVSSSVSKSEFECLKNDGYSYAIVRAHHSNGGVDPNAPLTIGNAWSAGMSRVDAYLFPCFRCGDPEGQVKETVDYLNEHGVRYGTLWLDIEQNDWSSDHSKNQDFFASLYDAAKSRKSTGVYTSQYQWNSIMGSDYTKGGSSPLWYPHYDSEASFSDFQSFGGWSRPAIKQYVGNALVCGVGVDKNYYP